MNKVTERNRQKACEAYDRMLMAARTLYSIWMLAKPFAANLSPTTKNFALNQVIKTCNRIAEEAEKCL